MFAQWVPTDRAVTFSEPTDGGGLSEQRAVSQTHVDQVMRDES